MDYRNWCWLEQTPGAKVSVTFFREATGRQDKLSLIRPGHWITVTAGTDIGTVSRERSACQERVPTTPVEVDMLADARAEADRRPPSTRRDYVAAWRYFTG